MSRPSDPSGVTYEGSWPLYTVRLHGDPVGRVESNRRRHPTWRASSDNGRAWWFGRTMGEAVTPLIAWHQAGRP